MARQKQLPKGIRIRINKKSETLQIAFSYKGIECRESLFMPPTPANIRYAQRLRHEIQAEIERGTFNYTEKFPESKRARKFGFNTEKPFLSELLDRALEIKKEQIKPSSYRAYENAVKFRLKPDLGHFRIDHITPKIIRDWFIQSGLSAKTLRNYRVMLDVSLNLAVQDQIIERNPSSTLRLEHILPKKKQTTDYSPDPLTKAEIKKLVSAADEWFKPMIITWIFTGMRPGEIIALTWADIDFERKVIDINKSHVLGNEQSPKTETSIREIDMLPIVFDALKDQRKNTYCLEGNQGAVFRFKKSKTPFKDHRNLGRYVWKPTIKAAKIRYRNQYQCRHTFASQMLTEGNDPYWLAKQLGHKGTDMINRVYGQWIQDNNESRYVPKGDWSGLV